MSLRRTLATFLLLPLIVLLEGAAWYGAHSVLLLYSIEEVGWGGLGMSAAEAGQASATIRLLSPLAVVLGGLLAAAVGSQGMILAGLFLVVPGLVLMGFPTPILVAVGAVVLMLGHGMVRPALYGATTSALPGRAEHLRTAALALVYTAVNLGAVSAPAGAVAIRAAFGFRPVYFAAAGLALLALLAAALLVGAVLWTRQEVAAPPAPAPPIGRVLAGAALLGVLAFLPWVGAMQSWDLFFLAQQTSDLPTELRGLWMNVNPLVCMTTGVLIAAVAGGLHLAKLRLPALFPMALGLLLLAVGQAIVLILGFSGSPWPSVAGMGISAMGEALLLIFLASRMLGDVHWRLAALVIALWLAGTGGATQLLSWGSRLLELPGWSQAVGWTSVGSALLSALVLAVTAIPAQRWFWRAGIGNNDGR